MTGFGRGNFANELFAVRMEIRSVNHRYLEISLRLPRVAAPFEDRLRQHIGGQISRGKVDVFVHLELTGGFEAARVRFDAGLASAYRQALIELARLYDLPMEPRLEHLISLPDLFTVEQAELDQETLWEGLRRCSAAALEELASMRRSEGEKLLADLLKRVHILNGLTKTIEDRAPAVPEAYRALLRRRLEEALGQPGIDETRLAQEVAVFADRCCITEEVVRLKSHLDQLQGTLRMNGAIGRKADFIVQEINRELNTIGAKANDLIIAQAVIEAKTELEKVREQIQNLE